MCAIYFTKNECPTVVIATYNSSAHVLLLVYIQNTNAKNYTRCLLVCNKIMSHISEKTQFFEMMGIYTDMIRERQIMTRKKSNIILIFLKVLHDTR